MSTAAKRLTKTAIVVALLDPRGTKRAQARRQRWMIGAAATGAILAVVTTALQRRAHARAAAESKRLAGDARGMARTAGITDVRGHYRSRHGAGADPLDTLAAHAARIQATAADEPGFNAHLGFGIGGSIPTGRMGDAIPTAGGDALGGTVRGGEDVGYADEIVTGAGEAISNSTTPAQHGNGHTPH